ncbi:hypothetical protein Tco_1307798, partial [Tanacetum coccineum]
IKECGVDEFVVCWAFNCGADYVFVIMGLLNRKKARTGEFPMTAQVESDHMLMRPLPAFIEGHTQEDVGIRVADSHTSNHREDDFRPLETIRKFLGVFGSRSLSSSEGRP